LIPSLLFDLVARIFLFKPFFLCERRDPIHNHARYIPRHLFNHQVMQTSSFDDQDRYEAVKKQDVNQAFLSGLGFALISEYRG